MTTPLKTFIDAEPANAALDDAARLVWLEASQDEWVDVVWLEYAIWLSGNDGVDKMTLGLDSVDQPVRSACQLGLTVLNAGQSLALSRSEIRSSLSKIDNGVIFTNVERDVLLAQATAQVPRWKQQVLTLRGARLRSLNLDHVALARNED
tara:strand:+ start:5117 stop:5566 length:450 start_codon:yes stop_codon:yes gene_type:complete